MRRARARVKQSAVLRACAFAAQNAVGAARSVVSPQLVELSSGAPRYALAAMIRVKDEARFLPEWLAHHVGLGVEHAFVYDNNSTDDTRSVIEPFVERGLVTYVPWPTVPASPSSHHDFLARFGAQCTWVAFLDADEFLVETETGDLLAVLAAARGPAVAVNWRYFGSSGHLTVPPGLVTQHFDRADATHDHHVKVIARPAAVYRYRNSHNFYFRRGRLARTPGGRRVFGSFTRPPTRPRLVIRHYVYRSRDDYERKAHLGFVDASGARDRARVADRDDREFDRHNDVRVPAPPGVLGRTAALLLGLGYPAEIVGSVEAVAAATSPDDRSPGAAG